MQDGRWSKTWSPANSGRAGAPVRLLPAGGQGAGGWKGRAGTIRQRQPGQRDPPLSRALQCLDSAVFFRPDQSDQGAVTDANGIIYDASHPASTGAVAVIYCTGLGVVDSNVPAGSASPGKPLANATGPVAVTIGDKPVIPDSMPTGSAVPVNVSVGGRSSNPVTIAIK